MEENRELDRAFGATPAPHRGVPRWGKILGFLVLTAILGSILLATFVVPKVVVKLSMAVLAKTKADIMAISAALNEYAIDHQGHFPESLQLLWEKREGKQYLEVEAVPVDPWGRPYGYEPKPKSGSFRVFSLGADGQPGGEGEDRDIDNLLIREGKI